MIDIRAPIVPHTGIGGFRLNWTKEDTQLFVKGQLDRPEYLYNGLWSEYRFGDCLTITFDERTNRLFRMTAWPGYQGVLNGEIGVGMHETVLAALKPPLQYDDDEDVYISKEHGVIIEIEPERREIAYICVVVRDYEEILNL